MVTIMLKFLEKKKISIEKEIKDIVCLTDRDISDDVRDYARERISKLKSELDNVVFLMDGMKEEVKGRYIPSKIVLNSEIWA
jgi:hypothetical protein